MIGSHDLDVNGLYSILLLCTWSPGHPPMLVPVADP